MPDDNRFFRLFIRPEATKDLNIGMTFMLISVNRQTGELRFAQKLGYREIPKDE